MNLNSYGRDYQLEDVANFIVCVQQNFLTVFAGLPGVGKTSLATYLARSFGLEDQKRFLTISTARGWTSQRDILGFYNPLTHKYQASPTGLYQILKACHQESQTTALSQFPYWILLDEANLSPIEHYWSAFLGMCDDHYEREIHTGDPETAGKLIVPQSIRFIATVNYDNTTEPLSPRVIDRVPVVLLRPAEKQSYLDENSPISSFEGILSSADLETILCPKHSTDESLTNDESRILSEILTVLQVVDPSKYSMPIIISPRKQRAIGKYCSAARDLMKGKYDLRAFDYAVAQHILPLINGNGERYLNRLKELLNTIRQLDYSRETLNHIIAVGESEQNFYRFFC